MIMASLPVFGEITAVVFTANKVLGGAQHPDTISHHWFGLLKVASPTRFSCSIQHCLQVFIHAGDVKFLLVI